MIKAVFLYNQPRQEIIDAVKRKERHDGPLYGMLRLPRYGIEVSIVELEDIISQRFAKLVRNKVLNIYFIHLPLFLKILQSDIIFTPTALGSQFLWTLYPFKKPRWVMYDFSIAGFLGRGGSFKRRIYRWMVSCASGIVTISEIEAAKLQKMFPHMRDRIRFVPYGVDCEYFKLTQTTEEDLVLGVGLDRGRDYKTLIQACEGLNLKMLITGDPKRFNLNGPLPSQLEVKWLSHDEIRQQYARAKVVAIPLDISSGTNDAMGVSSVVEALAMGKAVIATDTPTMRSYIKDGETGILVTQGDARALRTAIVRVIKDDTFRATLGKAARESSLTRFEAEKSAESLASFLRMVL